MIDMYKECILFDAHILAIIDFLNESYSDVIILEEYCMIDSDTAENRKENIGRMISFLNYDILGNQ